MRRFFEQLDPCLVGIEACGTSHYWAREITKLGHEVRLMPPAYVKPYVKRGKTDAGDAEAICEAVTRPTMRYVAIKSPEQQAALALHRTRDLFVKQRTQLVNMIRGLLAEFGIEIRRGIEQAMMLAKRIAAGEVPDIPPLAAKVIAGLAGQVLDLQARLNVRSNANCWPGIARTTSPSGLQRSRGSERCAPQRLRPLSPTRISSVPDGSSPPGWA
jgi:transposase